MGRHYWQLPDGETQVNLVREARASALVIVLCDVLLDAPVAELARRSALLGTGSGRSRGVAVP